MEELFPLIEDADGQLRICGFAERHFVHGNSLRHMAVQIIPVMPQAGNEVAILVHRRSEYKRTCPNMLDFCGGHISFDPGDCPQSAWAAHDTLWKASQETAIREAQEEIRCTPEVVFTAEDLYQLGAIGAFECETQRKDGSWNREFSSAFVVGIPPDHKVTVHDTDKKGERELAVQQFTFSRLLGEFEANEDDFADGAARILKQVIADGALKEELTELLHQAAAHAETRTS